MSYSLGYKTFLRRIFKLNQWSQAHLPEGVGRQQKGFNLRGEVMEKLIAARRMINSNWFQVSVLGTEEHGVD